MKKLTTYLKDSITELKKVTWPTRKQVTTYSIIVVVMTIGVAIFFGVLDYIFGLGLNLLIR